MERPEEQPEIPKTSPLIKLAETLGLTETTDMGKLRKRIIESLKNEDDCIDDYKEYERLTEKIINEPLDKCRTAVKIMKASMCRTSGDNEAFKKQITEAIKYAGKIELNDIADIIQEETSEASSLAKLVETLGLVENQKMYELGVEIIESLTNGEDCSDNFERYKKLALQIPNELFNKSRIASMLMKASIFHAAGDSETLEEQIEDAIDCADGMGFDDIVDIIEKLRSR